MDIHQLDESKTKGTIGVLVEPFRPEDQPAVKALILAGLAEHWGWLDPLKNPDLEDIASSYKGSVFLVARQDGRVIGSGALVLRSEETAEIVRMSVAAPNRRQGLGRLILQRLIDFARDAGMKRIELETTADWLEVVAFYKSAGFRISHYKDGDVYFYIELSSNAVPPEDGR